MVESRISMFFPYSMRQLNPKKRLIVASILTFAVFAAVSVLTTGEVEEASAVGSTEMFMNIDGIPGESTAAGHENEIDVTKWSWGMSQSGGTQAGGGGGGKKVSVQDLSFTKFTDAASTKLMQHCCSGKHIKEAKLTVRKVGDHVEYLIITMSEVGVTSVSTGGSSDEDRPTENVTLTFQKVKVEYQEQNEHGIPIGDPSVFSLDTKTGKEF